MLIHSPLVGPYTWEPVAAALQALGHRAIAPALPQSRAIVPPYWPQFAASVAADTKAAAADEPIILAGHSGGGLMLPMVRAALGRPVAAYIFVDAGIPSDGKSPLDFFDAADAAEFRARAIDGLVPPWTDDDLADVLPDADVRRRFACELAPLPLAVYEEPLQVFTGWPDAPCAYLQFSPFYDEFGAQARVAAWPYRNLGGDHFYLLNEPQSVAQALDEIAKDAKDAKTKIDETSVGGGSARRQA